jgi:hypothetical protein
MEVKSFYGDLLAVVPGWVGKQLVKGDLRRFGWLPTAAAGSQT